MITRSERKKCPDYYWEFVKLICKKCSCLSDSEIDAQIDNYRRVRDRLRLLYPKMPYEIPETVASRICCGYFGKWNYNDDHVNFWIRQMIVEIKQLYRNSLFQLASQPDRMWESLPGYPNYTDGNFERFEKYRNEQVDFVMPLWKKWSEDDAQLKNQGV